MGRTRYLPASETIVRSVTVGSAGGDVRPHVALGEDLENRDARGCGDEPGVPCRQILLALVDRHLPGGTSTVEVSIVERLVVGTDFTPAEQARIQPSVAGRL